MEPAAAHSILMYVVLPLWLAAGFADYLCRAAHIQSLRAARSRSASGE